VFFVLFLNNVFSSFQGFWLWSINEAVLRKYYWFWP